MAGPLQGVRIIEMAGIGPGPFAGMMLADHGAEVIRVDRPGRQSPEPVLGRNRKSIVVDLKSPEGIAVVRELVKSADGFFEGLRPGVMERLGLGPDLCLARNPKLVYGRMTGWGQHGPLANAVGHDINYIATTGALHTMGRAGEPPAIPLNLVGDFGGGALFLAFGVLAALHEARSSGRGQVVDAAMVDGTLALLAPVIGRWQNGDWLDRRESNLLDGGAHFYRTYATSDGEAVAVGAIEPRFYAALLNGLGLSDRPLPVQQDRSQWPAMRERLAAIFALHTRDHWTAVFHNTEACVTPVLSLAEMSRHPHILGRESLVDVGSVLQPAPAPRFSRTPGAVAGPPAERGEGGEEALADWGVR